MPKMAASTKTDTDIQLDVLAELDWDSQIEPTEVGVEVDDGVVTLTGAVDMYVKKLAAERAAFRVEGVRAVANDLSIHSPAAKPNDTDIATAAATALETHVYGLADQVDVVVNNGQITLSGAVDWSYKRAAAEAAVRHLDGVRDVINQVTVRQPKVSATAVESRIERALDRAAEVDASRIRVHVDDSHVRLTGTVRSWAEKQAAAEAAWRAKGVTTDDNDLLLWIDPSSF
jgi:osmotically-inducible protein OsmY